MNAQNIWDFDRITKGPLAGSYVHCKFLRGNPSLCLDMVRQRQVSGGIPEWPCDEMHDQLDFGTRSKGATRFNESTVDVGSHHGQQQKNHQGNARPMTLNECIAFFYEKDRVRSECQIVPTVTDNSSILPPIISFDNLFEACFSIEETLETTIQPPANSSHPSDDPSLLDNTKMGMHTLHPTNLIEPVWHDMEMIFS